MKDFTYIGDHSGAEGLLEDGIWKRIGAVVSDDNKRISLCFPMVCPEGAHGSGGLVIERQTFRINQTSSPGNPSWGFDPATCSITPSILQRRPWGYGLEPMQHHIYLTDGKVNILGDTTHHYVEGWRKLRELQEWEGKTDLWVAFVNGEFRLRKEG